MSAPRVRHLGTQDGSAGEGLGRGLAQGAAIQAVALATARERNRAPDAHDTAQGTYQEEPALLAPAGPTLLARRVTLRAGANCLTPPDPGWKRRGAHAAGAKPGA